MSQYNNAVNVYLEQQACQLLNQALSPPYRAERNNLTSNEIDVKITDGNGNMLCTIDVQYSMNFGRYGDVRVDLMSAGALIQPDNHCVHNVSVYNLNQHIKQSAKPYEAFQALFDIKKQGKYFETQAATMLGVFYFFYQGSFDKTVANFKHKRVSFCFFLPKSVVKAELEQNPKVIININDKRKNGICESHHSAFACLNVNQLAEKYALPIFPHRQALIDGFYPLFEQELAVFNERF